MGNCKYLDFTILDTVDSLMPLDVAICRMCLRDIKNYEVSAEYRLNQYLRFVRPAYFRHILPTKQYADIVVKNDYDSHLNKYVDDYLLKQNL